MTNSQHKDAVSYVTSMVSGNFTMVHHSIIRHCDGDANPALILEYIIGWYNTNPSETLVFTNNHFIEKLGMSPYRIRVYLNVLKEKGLIEESFRDFPKRRVITLKFDAIRDVMLSKPSDKKKITKPEFYKKMSHIASYSRPEAMAVLDNIPRQTKEFIFFWGKLCKSLHFRDFKWTDKEYGYFSNYFTNSYIMRSRDYNFSRIEAYLKNHSLSSDEHSAMKDFIAWDKRQKDSGFREIGFAYENKRYLIEDFK